MLAKANPSGGPAGLQIGTPIPADSCRFLPVLLSPAHFRGNPESGDVSSVFGGFAFHGKAQESAGMRGNAQ
eukprot:4859189-Alexandrium_andersonii.AAC.1